MDDNVHGGIMSDLPSLLATIISLTDAASRESLNACEASAVFDQIEKYVNDAYAISAVENEQSKTAPSGPA